MTLDLALDEARPGVRFVQMDQALARPWLRAIPRRLINRLSQVFINDMMRRGAALMHDDPQGFAKEVARWRAIRMSVEPATLPVGSVGAIKVANPQSGLAAPPVPSDWFAPVRGETRGFLFYVHGGSFVFDRSPALTELVMRFAAGAGARVFAPNYRLAPEHPCPAAVDDILAAFRWFRTVWPDEPVVALADSAGCSVLLAAMHGAKRAGLQLPDGIVLLSPWLDLSLQSWSVIAATLSGTSGTTMGSLALMAHLYLDGRPATDPVASPLYGDFADFPPMLIHASRGDALYDDAVRLADRVRDVGGDLTVRLWTDEGHVWEKSKSAKARESIELSLGFIQRRLG